MERSAGGARRFFSGSATGARETLPQLLVATVWVCETAGLRPGRSSGPYPRFFRLALGKERPGFCPARERAVALLSSRVTQKFSSQGSSPHYGGKARRRQTTYPTRRIARA